MFVSCRTLSTFTHYVWIHSIQTSLKDWFFKFIVPANYILASREVFVWWYTLTCFRRHARMIQFSVTEMKWSLSSFKLCKVKIWIFIIVFNWCYHHNSVQYFIWNNRIKIYTVQLWQGTKFSVVSYPCRTVEHSPAVSYLTVVSVNTSLSNELHSLFLFLGQTVR